ncbi:MAG: hypothetical protein K6G65_05955 [Lachnospiraceae bacterium]|nr:hypothetical protein [Lachnospiraceae bacterium]
MLKKIGKIIVLFAVFVAALFIMSTDMTEVEIGGTASAKMQEATFPLVTLKSGDQIVNQMHGYSSSIDANVIREAIVPMDAEKTLGVNIESGEHSVKKVKYEIHQVETNELLDSGSISALDETQGGKFTEIHLDANLESGKEYAMRITLVTADSVKINYYSRIKYYDTDYFLDEKMDFIKSFHKKSLSLDDARDLAVYLENEGSRAGDSFANVSIHSTFDLFSWGDLEPEVVKEAIPTIKEFNVETAAVEMVYFVTLREDPTVYQVKENYRMRYTKERIYLLDYNRTMMPVTEFKIENRDGKNGIALGITDEKQVQIKTAAENNKLAYVANGALWYYNLSENKVVKVFSFLGDDATDVRDTYNQHRISILEMDDKGKIDFMVYGYMNRGEYEGKVAIVLYEYSPVTDLVEEKVYIPIDATYQMLKEECRGFGYLNEKNVFYFSVYDAIYAYDLNTKELSEVATQVSPDDMVWMDETRAVGWISSGNAEGEANKEITLLDMESGESHIIRAGEGEQLRIYGDIQGNIIYGYVKTEEITHTTDGTEIVPAYKLEIADGSGKVVKDYEESGVFVTEASIEEGAIKLTRMKKNEYDRFEETSEDSIITQTPEEVEEVHTILWDNDTMKKLTYISLPGSFSVEEEPEFSESEDMVLTEDRSLYIEAADTKVEKYFVYTHVGIHDTYTDPAEAIVEADKEMGVVVASDNRIIWERGGKYNNKTLPEMKKTLVTEDVNSKGACVEMVLDYNRKTASATELSHDSRSAYELLQEYLDKPINLTGCNLDEVLYFVSGNRPVIAKKDSDNTEVLIIGYDEYYVTYYNPLTGATSQVLLSVADDMFKEAGNVFISYLD